MIPYSRQSISDDDIKAVTEALRGDFLTQGPLVPKFESEISHYCGSSYATAVNSASSALHIACLALGLGPGDYLWTSPNSFVASATCALHCGAHVDFVDIDMESFNISIEVLEAKLRWAEQRGTLPKILVPVHFAGQPCDMPAIYKLSEKYGFKIIEDASHALGSTYDDINVGSCRHSDITVFSFHPVKMITTCEGGIATTNNNEIAERMNRLRSHGITRDPLLMTSHSHNEIWNYEQIELGYNFRLSEIHAALGLNQMKSLSKFLDIRRGIAKRYDYQLGELPLITPRQRLGSQSSYHLYPILVSDEFVNNYRKKLYNFMQHVGVNVNIHYIPIHLQPYFQKIGFKVGDFPNAERYFRHTLSLPIYPDLTDESFDYIVFQLKDAFRRLQ